MPQRQPTNGDGALTATMIWVCVLIMMPQWRGSDTDGTGGGWLWYNE